ncbi:ChaC-like protein-domain-containing protein [Staphylotrichum tortipilum]|uniref:glutathione-specific gamma-glutamylcyclotransferase n=1 Tax=Staphylotrichum tortipilum TaxID=2831512 RepID=A0AAN6RU27_9PEZI|nr:ChaC-like protein-domain-containing protein [Staphylotrichum longicolle]
MSAEAPAAAADTGEFWLFGYGSLIWKPPPHFDRRIPGWVTGYVRRFWQVRAALPEDHRGTPSAPGRVVTLISRAHWETLADAHHGPAPDRVWGVAYRITPDRVAEVKDYLDIREINGYTIHYTPFHPAVTTTSPDPNPHDDSRPVTAPIQTLVYIGTPTNAQFVGPQPPQALAEHIFRSAGPSGANRDYLWGLEQALRELGPESGDEHVLDLSERVRAIAAREMAAAEGEEDEGKERQTDDKAPPLGVGGDGVVGVVDIVGPEHVLERERRHHEQHHDFKKVSSIDEQEETEKTS